MKRVLVDTNGQSRDLLRRNRAPGAAEAAATAANPLPQQRFQASLDPSASSHSQRPTGGSQLLDELPAAGRCARARRRCLSRLSLGLRSRRL